MPELTDPRLTLRRPTLADAEAMLSVVTVSDVADFGEADAELADIQQDLGAVDLDRDAWVVTAGDEMIASAILMLHGQVQHRLMLYVVPAWRRQGIASVLLADLEARSAELVERAPEGTRVVINAWTKGDWEPGLAFAARHGYAVSHRFQRMKIDMTEPPPPPVWTDGVTVRTFQPGIDERATFEAVDEAFSDHWGHLPMDFDEWRRRMDRDDFDPALWFLAVAGDEIAGTSLCNVIPGMGWVGSLSVRRAWRRRGLASALMLHSFGVFWERGQRSVGLGVDATSLTGATRLYESVGMSVDEQYDQLEKEVRPGRDLAVRALDA
jgi:mycothiol synthase